MNSDLWLQINRIKVPVVDGVFMEAPEFEKDYVFMGTVSLKDTTTRHDGRLTYIFELTGDYQLVTK